MSEMAIIAKNASCLRHVILTYGRVPIITRRVRALSFEDFFARLSAFSSRNAFSSGTKNFRGVFFRQSVTAQLEQESTLVPFFHDYFRGWNCKSLLLNSVNLLFTESILSHFPLNDDFGPSLTLGHYSCSNPFVPSFEVARPDRLINMSCHWCLQSGITRLFGVSNVLLFTQSQYSLKLSRISYV